MNISKRLFFYLKSLNIYLHYKLGDYKPFLAIIVPTKKCNLNCKYCIESGKQQKSLTKNHMLTLIDDLYSLSVSTISFSGGEPLLYPDLIEIAEYAQKKGFFVNLNTNGTLINELNAKRITNAFDTVRISLDGLEKSHDTVSGVKGTYNKVIKGIDYLTSEKKRKAKIGLNFVATRDNQKYIKEFVKEFENKVDFISFLPRFSFNPNCHIKTSKLTNETKYMQKYLQTNKKSGNTPAFMDKISLKFSKQNCDAGKLYFSIFPGGKVVICPFYRKFYGNLKKESIKHIYSRMKKEKNLGCNGCYATCTTEISRVFRLKPIELLREIPKLIKIFKIW